LEKDWARGVQVLERTVGLGKYWLRLGEVLDWVFGFEKGCVKLVQMVSLKAELGTAWL
jgi:hypothetical protein